jgi:hypothetical protein
MTRIKHNYPPTSRETVQALIACHDAAVSQVLCNDGGSEPSPAFPTGLLLKELPQGPITAARHDAPTGLIAFTIKDRNERYLEPEAFLMVRTLMLLEPGSLHIDTSTRQGDANGFHYVEVFADQGITLQRLTADAQQGEVVKIIGDHHDLSARNLRVANGPKTAGRGRREAIAEALRFYDLNAKEWGLTDLISREDYRLMIRNAFRLYDTKHSRHHLRAIGTNKA